MRDGYRTHWLKCEKPTEHCFSCRLYTQTNEFNFDYRKTEALTPMAFGDSPWDYPEATRPARRPRQAPAPAPVATGKPFEKATSACPYGDDSVTLIVFKGNDFTGGHAHTAPTQAADVGRYVKSKAEKIQVLLNLIPGNDLILVAWPGATQNIFAITTKDQRDKALTRLGLKAQATPTTTLTAADGTVFIQNT